MPVEKKSTKIKVKKIDDKSVDQAVEENKKTSVVKKTVKPKIKKTTKTASKTTAKTKVVKKKDSSGKDSISKTVKRRTTKKIEKKDSLKKVPKKEDNSKNISGEDNKPEENVEPLITMEAIKNMESDREKVLAEEKKSSEAPAFTEKKVDEKYDNNKVKVYNEDKMEELVLKGRDVKNVLAVKKDVLPIKEEEQAHIEKIEEAIVDNLSANRSIGMYRKIALSFIILTVVLLAAIFYFSFTRVKITVIPNQERISNNLIFDIYDTENADSVSSAGIPGIVREITIDDTKEYESTGSNVIGKEVVGKVDIINEYTKNQPLVANTRLLTPDGKLFRLKETVNVPVGGIKDIEVYADEAKPEMAVGPTTFTIPGLWAGLQDKIYAKSESDIVYRQKIKKYITDSDIDTAEMDLKEQLLASVKSKVNDIYKDYEQVIFKIDEKSIKSDINSKVNDEVDAFEISMEAKVMVVAFDDETAAKLAKNKFTSSLPENKELISFNEDNIIYSLNNYNGSESIASVNATFEGKVSLKGDSNIVDVQKILGLNQKQLETYLGDMPEIAGFEIEFYPKFIKKVPKLVDKIEIEIKK